MTSNPLSVLSKLRWHDAGQFRDWRPRNRLMRDLLSRANIDISQASFSEYGCGPERPFYLVLDEAGFQGQYYPLDMKAWQDDVIVTDLESADFEALPKTDIGVLSGVLEYIANPAELLSKLKQQHPYLVISYRLFESSHAPLDHINKELQRRTAENGFKTHFNIDALLAVITHYGFILQTDVRRGHMLFLLERSSIDS